MARLSRSRGPHPQTGADTGAHPIRDHAGKRPEADFELVAGTVTHQTRNEQRIQEIARRPQEPRPRDIVTRDVRPDNRREHEPEVHQLRDTPEEPVLGAAIAGFVQRIDAPRVDRAVAKRRADPVDQLPEDKHRIVIREEVDHEGQRAQTASEHEGTAAAECVGKGAGRDVGQERHGEIDREHGIDLELVETARVEEDRVDAVEEAARERIRGPDAAVAPENLLDGQS